MGTLLNNLFLHTFLILLFFLLYLLTYLFYTGFGGVEPATQAGLSHVEVWGFPGFLGSIPDLLAMNGRAHRVMELVKDKTTEGTFFRNVLGTEASSISRIKNISMALLVGAHRIQFAWLIGSVWP